MKSVLISIQPKWCEMIISGKKTVEVRKTKPKIEPPFKVYIYETKGKTEIPIFVDEEGHEIYQGRGQVIGEFVCDAVISHCEMANADIAEQQGCIKREDLFEYAGNKELYGWHISDLVIYDTPKELGEFWNADKCPYASKNGCTYKLYCFRAGQTKRCGSTLTRPPQSWCYVEKGR